jgi:hypothetical protein
MFGELAKRQPLVLVVTAEPLTAEHRSRILDFVAATRFPPCTKTADTWEPAV